MQEKPKPTIHLARCILLAQEKHAGQVDKAGQPYLKHCISVMTAIQREMPEDDDAQCAAVLHDIIEDCGMSPYELHLCGVSDRAVQLILWLTKTKAFGYQEWIGYLARNAPAAVKRIKIADLRDNGSPARLALIEDEALRERLRRKYDEALLVLIESL